MKMQQVPVPAEQTLAFHSSVGAEGVDEFSRVKGEATNDARRYLLAEGTVDSTVTKLTASLIGQVPVPGAELNTVADTWNAPMLLRPLAARYDLQVDVEDNNEPSFTATANSQFTVARRAQTNVAVDYDEEEQVIARSWTGGRERALTWDAAGRLTQVIEFKVSATNDNEPAYASMDRPL